jgi:16S rRNA (cytosine967-C5)-methyltransferase
MANPRIIENQRRNTLTLIDAISHRMPPGRPFIPEMRSALAANQGFGARDRRLYRELIFTWLRFRAWFDRARAADPQLALNLLVALAPESPEVAPLQAALAPAGAISLRSVQSLRDGLSALLPGMTFELRELMPGWFEAHCPKLFEEEEILTQLRRPPFWLRTLRGSGPELVQEFARTNVAATASTKIPGAVRVHEYRDLEEHPLITSGRAEIQDIGSQALLVIAAPAPGGRWLDLCAGAGGKSLQLAAMVGSTGRVTAHDIRRDALMETRRRLIRAGVRNLIVEPVLPEPGPVTFDGVLVDAPCSASGTWRRHPFLRHQTIPGSIMDYAREQFTLLRRGGSYVAPGGRLVYATCSLSRFENEDVVDAFLREETGFALERPTTLPEGVTAAESGCVTLWPSALDSDGYFIACMRRK